MNPLPKLLLYLRPYRAVILLTLLISALVLVLQALSAWVGAGFIERVLQDGTGAKGLMAGVGVGEVAAALTRMVDALLTRSTPYRSLTVAVVLLVGMGFLTMVLRVCKTALFARLSQNILCRVRMDVFEHLTRLDLSFSKRVRPGEVASIMGRDVDALRYVISDLCDRVFMQPLRLVFSVVMLWSLSPILTAVFLAALLGCAIVAHSVGGYVHRLARKSMERIAHVQGFLTEYLTTVLLARSLGRETHEKRRFDDMCVQMAKADVALTVTDSLAPQLIYHLFILASAAILLYGGQLVLVGHTMQPGALLRFVLLLPMASYPVEALALLYVSLRRSMASATRVFAILDETPLAADQPDAVDAPGSFNAIDFDHVSFLPAGRNVFENLSFRISAGERVLLCGASGSGKTSVLHMLAGVVRPDAGAIRVDGQELQAFRGESWRHRLGIVPQEPLMMNVSVRENLLFACEGASEEQLVATLMRVKFEPDEATCRLALDRPVGNRGEFLSGGERQRLAIGRALLLEPKLLLLDEPVAHLDAVNRLRVKEAIAALPRTMTLVFTSHDEALHDLADHVIHLGKTRELNAFSCPP